MGRDPGGGMLSCPDCGGEMEFWINSDDHLCCNRCGLLCDADELGGSGGQRVQHQSSPGGGLEEDKPSLPINNGWVWVVGILVLVIATSALLGDSSENANEIHVEVDSYEGYEDRVWLTTYKDGIFQNQEGFSLCTSYGNRCKGPSEEVTMDCPTDPVTLEIVTERSDGSEAYSRTFELDCGGSYEFSVSGAGYIRSE